MQKVVKHCALHLHGCVYFGEALGIHGRRDILVVDFVQEPMYDEDIPAAEFVAVVATSAFLFLVLCSQFPQQMTQTDSTPP